MVMSKVRRDFVVCQKSQWIGDKIPKPIKLRKKKKKNLAVNFKKFVLFGHMLYQMYDLEYK